MRISLNQMTAVIYMEAKHVLIGVKVTFARVLPVSTLCELGKMLFLSTNLVRVMNFVYRFFAFRCAHDPSKRSEISNLYGLHHFLELMANRICIQIYSSSIVLQKPISCMADSNVKRHVALKQPLVFCIFAKSNFCIRYFTDDTKQ